MINDHALAPDCDTEGSVRLIGGTVPSEGQLQICFKQHWTYVCEPSSYDFLLLGSIVCKQLGYHRKCKSNRHTIIN